MTSLTTRLRRAWTSIFAWVTAAGRRVYAFFRAAAARLADRWSGDSAFRRTVTSAITAITLTAIPSAALAAAVGAFLAEHASRPVSSYSRFADYDDEDHPADWPPRAGRLWDSLT